ncbi:MAG: cyclic pyranopterin monophosphate synthase MoaC [Planctomycetota bacterium]
MAEFTHIDSHGAARMVDVGHKPVTVRSATASGLVLMQPETLRLIRAGSGAKGNILETARLAGIMAAKRTSEWIPLCHQILLSKIQLDFQPTAEDRLAVTATVSAEAKTGVEMEALTAVAAACLTIYDMCKAVDRDMEITGICLLQKSGGQSGDYLRHSVSAPSDA